MENDDRRWNCRKTIGFRSQEHYEQIMQEASSRGLTVAKYLSWLADVHLKSDRSEREPLLLSGSEAKQITIRMSQQDVDILKSCSESLGMSANAYLVRLLREDNGKVNTWSVPNRQLELKLVLDAELKLVLDAEAQIVNLNSKEALEVLRKLKMAIVNSQVQG